MALNLKYTLQNIGNIDNADITIKPLTIIAGENSSGKTFLTKSLYTILNSIYKDHFSDDLIKKFTKLDKLYKSFIEELNKPVKVDLEFNNEYSKYADAIVSIIEELTICNFKDQQKILEEAQNIFYEFENIMLKYFENRNKLQKFQKYTEYIENILESLTDLLYTVNNRVEVIIESINSSLDVGFKKNYQITNLQSLIKRNQKENLNINIDGIGSIDIDNKSNINFDFNELGIEKIQNVKNIVFFDSPVYIKIRKALEKNSGLFDFLTKKDDKYLRGYPEYLEQLYTFIDKEYIDISDFNEISQDIQKIIEGKLDTTKSGDIQYIDNNGSTIPLSLTAMGISNIGLIDLLLRNNVINKGSFLIMDEPEVHLHPKWQVALAKILYKIAKSGANIIIASHSLDLLKAFQVILKNDPETANDIIAINKMPYTHEFLELSEIDKIDTVLDDLSKPYYDLYMNKS